MVATGFTPTAAAREPSENIFSMFFMRPPQSKPVLSGVLLYDEVKFPLLSKAPELWPSRIPPKLAELFGFEAPKPLFSAPDDVPVLLPSLPIAQYHNCCILHRTHVNHALR